MESYRTYGYPHAIGGMAAVAVALYGVFTVALTPGRRWCRGRVITDGGMPQ
ncbi:MAG: hypothetical protein WAK00_01950 [Microbacterium sp.]|uniref:hypothetical protein n=1 Tax=Microbacterium sp. TaxID=51671 RepID=UPI003BB02A43